MQLEPDHLRQPPFWNKVYKVNFLLFQELTILGRSSNFFSKFSLSLVLLSLVKWIPRAYTETSGNRKPNGLSFLPVQGPNHMASVFDLFNSSPEHLLNFSNISSNSWTDSRSLTKRVVSSAYRVFFISSSPTDIPLMLLFVCIARFSSSIPRTNSRPDNGQPCLTPRLRLKKGEAKPLFVTQLEMSV